MVLTGVGRSIAGAEEQPTKIAVGIRIMNGSTKEMALRTSHSRSARLWIVRQGCFRKSDVLGSESFMGTEGAAIDICNLLVALYPPIYPISLEKSSKIMSLATGVAVDSCYKLA